MKPIIVIPAYNEALNIENVIHDIQTKTSYEYIIINDCSKDNTVEVCDKNGFHYLNLPINYGLSSAVQVGLKYALIEGYDAAVQFDGDGQHCAEYLSDLFQAIEDGADIAIGSRFIREKKPFTARMLGSRLISFLIKITTGKTIKDPTSGMRAFNRAVMEEYAYNMNYPPEPDTLVYMLKKKKNIKEVQVHMEEREFGESYLNPIRSIAYMLEMCISILLIQNFRKR